MLFASATFAFVLMAVAWMMHTQHQQTIKQLEQHHDWDPKKRDYLLSQVQRRKRVTYTIAIIAVAILVGPFVRHPIVFLVFWSVVLLLVLGMVILAGIDVFATKTYILSLRDQRIASRRALEEEVKRIREQQAANNLNAPHDPPGPASHTPDE